MVELNLDKFDDDFSGCLILFLDNKTKNPPNLETGCNQTGVFISNKDILFCRKRKVEKIQINDLAGSRHRIIELREKTISSSSIIEYFQKSKSNYRLTKLGFLAIMNNNLQVFSGPYIMPVNDGGKLRRVAVE